ncbi:probable fatty acid-binding protein [Trichoplusia ni]|uniref:Probable fatty acid-binding protein n=1 Tax=Trichoplusia ni TaxID=7111 RepID=A0A7E5VHH0_TRINI|nr:probable fatty acid-binding protein [Trichoplusia ni]
MDAFLGKKYVLANSENFEDYLIFLDYGYFARKTAMSLRQEHILTLNDDGSYTFVFTSPLASSTVTFTPGVELEEIKADGVKVKCTITLDDNVMTHIQVEDSGRTSKHVREFYEDKMIVTTTADGFNKTAVRFYVAET